MTSASDLYDRPRCSATKVNGERCTAAVVPELDVCHRHLEQSDLAESPALEDRRPGSEVPAR